jgi:hypothetical protein
MVGLDRWYLYGKSDAVIQDSCSVACLARARARLFFLKSFGGLSKAIRTPRLIVEYPINERQLES